MKFLHSIKIPQLMRKGMPVYAEDYNDIIRALESVIRRLHEATLRESPDIGTKHSGNGTTAWIKRRFGAGGSGAPVVACPFGEIYRYTDESSSDSTGGLKTGIRGGFIVAGAQTWNFISKPFEIDLDVDAEFPVWIKVILTVNIDSANVATLSGVATSVLPTWEHGAGSDDPLGVATIPKAFPLDGSAAGVLIVPIGMLKVAAGVATLTGATCGDIIATYCPGELGYRRGHVDAGSSTME